MNVIINPNWYKPSKPQDIKPVPWLHPVVVKFFENILEPHWNVIEHGCGGSTLWLSDKVNSVISFDNNEEWVHKVESLAPSHVAVYSGYIPRPNSRYYDLLFIDGQRESRVEWILDAHNIVRKGGWVILDNANRPEYKMGRSNLRNQSEFCITFDMNKPELGPKYMVTDFYRML